MARFEPRFKRSVAKDLRTLPAKDVKKILKRIESLGNDPRGAGCIKLTGKEYYRVRVGNYRVIYEVRDTELVALVIKVGHRGCAYE
ncbi:MAG: type II toxin-antitoxin system RelE/ParE family toxin [Gammaproteobacteria bacterium]|nr:type II toxin-antitoxin system RelE/ParE family toxin [Gammaproteobacteria bacterium]